MEVVRGAEASRDDFFACALPMRQRRRNVASKRQNSSKGRLARGKVPHGPARVASPKVLPFVVNQRIQRSAPLSKPERCSRVSQGPDPEPRNGRIRAGCRSCAARPRMSPGSAANSPRHPRGHRPLEGFPGLRGAGFRNASSSPIITRIHADSPAPLTKVCSAISPSLPAAPSSSSSSGSTA